ncbi:MAG: DUF433 domain-containing protein [Okeania sp. SIO3B5]|uniref:DUF433 domain-containing protein n=1 Tax=Okeania sp. SIO3B5 TaxID=2607811 RepID=UPI0013FF55FF|nr:DUF433 domain-containing protein [Okeania sp. SIO3B5]NEO53718.1 DUF433 domain-containing protein [Okeania sp. SIO3B5]
MINQPNKEAIIIRTERGLTISGTRITLYDIIDYLKAEYPPKYIRDAFDLTEEELHGVLSYIKNHQVEVETEYQEVLRMAEEIRAYWEERNRDRLAKIAASPPRPGYEAVRVKLIERKTKRQAKKK